jgi:hypothetical protein
VGDVQVDRSVQGFFVSYSLYIVIPMYTRGDCRIMHVIDTF